MSIDAENTGIATEIPSTPLTAEHYLNISQRAMGIQPTQEVGTVQAQINELVKQVTVTEDGKFIYPSGTPDHLKVAIASEKKARDTQASYTKSQQRLKALEDENKALLEQLRKSSTQGIAQEDLERLEEMKYEDPEAWYNERQRLEAESRAKHNQAIDHEQEIRLRRRYLEAVSVGREVPITEQLLNERIPPYIANKLRNNEVSFEEFIAEAIEYLDKGRVPANPSLPGDTKLGNTASSSAQTKGDSGIDYSKVTF